MDYKKFFGRKSEEVAQDLLGRFLIKTTRKAIVGMITQTGAYEEGKDIVSRDGMKYAPGTIFFMPFRGSNLLNIATEKEGYPSCVEIREVAFPDRVVTGSGAVTNFLDLKQGLEGKLVGKELKISGKPVEKTKIKKVNGTSENCLGYFLIK